VSSIPALRIQTVNDAPVRAGGDYVLYWMIANRRSQWNYSLDRAVEWCEELGKPLLILEAVRCDYPWASDRIHRFILQGMVDNRCYLSGKSVRYYPYVETEAAAGKGLVEAFAARASVVVTDDFPCFFLPRMVAAAADRLSVKCEAIDSNGLLPLRAVDRVFARAYDFRRWLHKNLAPFLEESPCRDPLAGFTFPIAEVSADILDRWPEASEELLTATPKYLSELPIDHQVVPAIFDGGTSAASKVLHRFFCDRLARYADERNNAEDEAASGFSSYLHFGHLSAHEVFARMVQREQWTLAELAEKGKGSREGWWGMSREAESFLDQLITWRELGYNMSWQNDNYMHYESLPEWAQTTLARHSSDPREYLYDLPELEASATHDEVWNAAQRQLVRDGRMHNYLRMLWGKKILEWSPTPRDALAVMIELNNKYAVDGRNPNSYSGIFWVLGRYDRAWGPERLIFGKIRYMTSANTLRKLKLKEYLKRYSR
jgi:deoxyribodipyrimidine photo-lyase